MIGFALAVIMNKCITSGCSNKHMLLRRGGFSKQRFYWPFSLMGILSKQL